MDMKMDKEIRFENVDISINVNAEGSGFNKDMKKNSKRKKIVTTAVAAISSLALLTSATYAWFYLTNKPTVSSMTMKAGTSGNLKICNTENGSFGSNISFEFKEGDKTIVPVLKPLASKDGYTFNEPIYNDAGKVNDVNTTSINEATQAKYFNNEEKKGGQLIKKDFYILAEAADDKTSVGIRLMGNYGSVDSDAAYTKIVDYDTVTNKVVDVSTTAAEAVRISFVYDNGGTKNIAVLEPNANYNDTSVKKNDIYDKTISDQYNPYVTGKLGAVSYKKIRQGTNFKFQSDYASATVTEASAYDQNYSPVLFNIPTNTKCKVTMYIWMEGTDANCTNAVEGTSLKTQLMFYSNDLS